MSRYVLGIDAGTTGVRAIVFDRGAGVCSRAYREIPVSYPRRGWVEQDAVEIWEATRAVISAALREISIAPSDIAGIGIANQRASVVAWEGGSLRALAPMLSWQDARCAERCQELQDEGLFVTPMMTASKAEWLVNNVAAVGEAARAHRLRLGTLNSWLAACLCGDINVSDHANASATGLYAHFESDWDGALVERLGLEPEWLPELVDSSALLATTREEVFGAAVPLAGMAGDQQASLFGLACLSAGDTKCSYGTSAMVTANTGAEVAVGGIGTYPIVGWSIDGKNTFSLEGNVVTAGAAVQWLRDGLALIDRAEETAGLAAGVRDSGGVWVVPAFQGLGTPAMSAEARAMIGGLSRGSTRAHVARAVLEGVAQRVVDVVESVWENMAPGDSLHVDGGAAANDFLMQAQADFLGLPVERSGVLEGAASGAAKLAGLAVGFWRDVAELEGLWRSERSFEPSWSEDRRLAARDVWVRRVDLAISAAL